jgi:hypothetical protein
VPGRPLSGGLPLTVLPFLRPKPCLIGGDDFEAAHAHFTITADLEVDPVPWRNLQCSTHGRRESELVPLAQFCRWHDQILSFADYLMQVATEWRFQPTTNKRAAGVEARVAMR